jgi:hypothetical protein
MDRFYFGSKTRIEVEDDGHTIALTNPSGKHVEVSFLGVADLNRFATAALGARNRAEDHVADRFGEWIAGAHENEGAR